MTLPHLPAPVVAPVSPDLTDDEQKVAWRLASVLFSRRPEYLESRQYYEGTQPVPSLGISVPPELESLRAIVGWGGSGVDAVVERLQLQGILLKGKSEVDDELQEVFQANNIDAESPMVHEDSQVCGNGLVLIGNGADGAIITGESPLNMTAHVDRATGITTCAYQTYIDADPASEHYASVRATIYLPKVTTHMVSQAGTWKVIDRDEHPDTAEFGCSVVAFPNRPTTGNRWGISEIAPAWRNCMNRAARTWVELEVMREFHIIQKIMFLGATEKAFQDGKGNYKTVWESYADIMPAIEPDEDGNVPEVKVIQGQSPEGLLKIIDGEARLMSGYTGLDPQSMGIVSTGNPVSGDSIGKSDFRLKRRTDRKTQGYGNGWVSVANWTYLVRGERRDELKRAEADWGPTGIPTPAADSDAVTKQIAAKLIPERSETGLAKLAYSAIQRQNIAEEWREFDGRALIEALVDRVRERAQQIEQGQGDQQPETPADGNAA
ncbi:Phage portal protein, SPP1 Gp6 [Mycobacteroides abscessus subsp. abscessus]|uniref:phage portal protein n=1 Tax=Mycobacteroides abscessus TaxID=36809 RepID=UPI0009272536|nr:phage portal protein [Mycobacteroides abscessus]SIM00971.1 Phage portal protein, SPP1 Gp6 [Mycobacteroides abscessus subsp. abscessus]